MTYPVDIKQLQTAAAKYVGKDVARMLNRDCQYLWNTDMERIIEKHPDGEIYTIDFHLEMVRHKAIKFSAEDMAEHRKQ